MKKKTDMQAINSYMSLPYPLIVAPYEEDGYAGYRAYLPDIPAIEAIGDTAHEALADLEGAKKEWFAFALAKGIRIPMPNPSVNNALSYSGRVTLRIPKTLHRQASERAYLEGVSLNALLGSIIERGLA